ncbi:MAG: 6-bladed beta-propeller [Balneolaceae bacterium]
MGLKIKISKYLVLCLVIGLSLVANMQAQKIPEKLVRFEDPELLTPLDSLDTYGSIYATDDRLIWYNLTFKRVHVYKLDTSIQHQIQLHEGRGPGELLSTIDLLVADDSVYLLDMNLMKMVKINIETEEANDIRLDSGPNGRFRNIGKNFYFWNIISPDVVLTHTNFEENKSLPINHTGINILKDIPSIFDRAGYLRVNGTKLYFITKYTPNIYVFDAGRKRFERKLSYDEVKVVQDRTIKMDDGSTMSLPPAKVEVLLSDFATIPQKPNSLFILARGKTKTRRYETDKLYEFDVNTAKMAKIHELGFKANHVAANGNHLFVYSKEGGGIYRYNIVITHP